MRGITVVTAIGAIAVLVVLGVLGGMREEGQTPSVPLVGGGKVRVRSECEE